MHTEDVRTETVESGEANPNDEIPVTYLFYELQRRFKIHEKLHRLMVNLVANHAPPPHLIDEDFLISND